jgi:hypothetical protein
MDKKGKFEKMAEIMRSCCKEKGSMADCCSMMKKMMGQKKRGEKKEKEGPSKEE